MRASGWEGSGMIDRQGRNAYHKFNNGRARDGALLTKDTMETKAMKEINDKMAKEVTGGAGNGAMHAVFIS